MPTDTLPIDYDALIPVDWDVWNLSWRAWGRTAAARDLIRPDGAAYAAFEGSNFLADEVLGRWASAHPGVYVELSRVTFSIGHTRAYVGLSWSPGYGRHREYEAEIVATFRELEQHLTMGPVPR